MRSNRRKNKASAPSNWQCCSSGKLGNWEGLSQHLAVNEEQAKFVDDTGSTPLHWACRKGAPVQIIKSLLAAFSDAVQLADNKSYTPLHYAVSKGASAELISHLLEACPAAASAQTSHGRTALHLAVIGKGPSIDVLIALLTCCKDAAILSDDRACTPLYYAICHGVPDEALLLLFEAAPSAATVPDNYGYLPLHRACIKDRSVRVVQTLADACCDVEPASLVTERGYTPLHYAAMYAQDEIVMLLLEASPEIIASFQTKDSSETALLIASSNDCAIRDRHLRGSYPKSKSAVRSNRVICALYRAAPSQIVPVDRRKRSSLRSFFRTNQRKLMFFLEDMKRSLVDRPESSLSFANLLEEKINLLMGAYYEYVNGSPLPRGSAWAHAILRIHYCPMEWFDFFLLWIRQGSIYPGYNDSTGSSLLHAAAASPWRGEGTKCMSAVFRCVRCSNPSRLWYFHPIWEATLCSTCAANAGCVCQTVDTGIDRGHLVISKLLKIQPRLVSIPNSSGRLPLLTAIEKIKVYDDSVKALIKAEPRAVATRDPVTHLYPFMLAAVLPEFEGVSGRPKDDNRCLEQISLVYELLRKDPSLLPS